MLRACDSGPGGGPGLWVEGLLARGWAGPPCHSQPGTSSAGSRALLRSCGSGGPPEFIAGLGVRGGASCAVQVRHPLLWPEQGRGQRPGRPSPRPDGAGEPALTTARAVPAPASKGKRAQHGQKGLGVRLQGRHLPPLCPGLGAGHLRAPVRVHPAMPPACSLAEEDGKGASGQWTEGLGVQADGSAQIHVARDPGSRDGGGQAHGR